MNCLNCKNILKKCVNPECNNNVNNCYKCNFNQELNKIEILTDFSKIYIPLNMFKDIKLYNERINLETICCKNIFCQIYIKNKYNGTPPIISLLYNDVKINVEFNKKQISN